MSHERTMRLSDVYFLEMAANPSRRMCQSPGKKSSKTKPPHCSLRSLATFVRRITSYCKDKHYALLPSERVQA
jgi:hypothetical protein